MHVPVWSPFLERDKKLIESVLRRVTKVIPGLKDREYEDRMKIPSITVTQVGFLRGSLLIAGKPKVTTVSVSGSCHKPPFTPHTLRALVRDNTEQVMSRSLFIGNRYSVAGCNRKSGSTVMF